MDNSLHFARKYARIFVRKIDSQATLAKNPYQKGIWYGNDRISLRDENARAVLVKSTSSMLPINIYTEKP